MATGFEQVELNYVVPQNFYMVIDRMPTVQYNLQQVQVPSISGGEADLANRMNPGKTFIPGNSLDYGTLDLTFLLDKRLETYREILKWLKGINHPDSHTDYVDWVKKPNSSETEMKDFEKTMSTINLYATDASASPIAEWVFYNAFPISLDGPAYDAGATDAEYLTSSVSFRYTHFEHAIYSDTGKRNSNLI